MNDVQDKSVAETPVLPATGARSVPARRVLASRELFTGGNHELHIEHNGFVYTLRLTSKGKLILTK